MKEGIYMNTEESKDHPNVINKVPFHGSNLFTREVPELKKYSLGYMKRMDKLGTVFMGAIAESLGFERDFFKK